MHAAKPDRILIHPRRGAAGRGAARDEAIVVLEEGGLKDSICMLAASLVLAAGASAQTYPTRPIRFITVAAPGTVGDIIRAWSVRSLRSA